MDLEVSCTLEEEGVTAISDDDCFCGLEAMAAVFGGVRETLFSPSCTALLEGEVVVELSGVADPEELMKYECCCCCCAMAIVWTAL